MYLVVDIGGTWIKYGYYFQDGSCQKSNKFPTSSFHHHLKDFYQTLESLILPNTEGLAISMPGIIDSQVGYVENITLLPFLNQHNIKEELEKQLHIPVSIENDANCAALGELWLGSLQNVRNGLIIVFGSGIGGTIILDGKVYQSPHHKAGEIGSLLMPQDFQYQQMTNFGRNNSANTLIHNIVQTTGCEENGWQAFEEMKTNKEAFHIFKIYCRQIAMMIYNLDYILDLDIVSIGGGISEQEIFITTIQKEFQNLRDLYQEDFHQPIIKACQYYNEANLLGALYHHLKLISQL